jgi:hypothetical protein
MAIKKVLPFLKVLPFAAAIALMSAAGVQAGGAVALTDAQLDSVSAGDAFTTGTANGQATGLYTIGFSGTTADTTGSNSPWGGSGGSSSGVAVAVGSNFTSPGTASTSVTTGGTASGNFVVTEVVTDKTLSGGPIGGNGVSFSAGYTYTFGALIPGCGASCL